MDFQARAFELAHLPVEADGGVPLRCPRVMLEQPLQVWTPVTFVGAMLMALLSLPRAAMLAPAMIRINRSRRA